MEQNLIRLLKADEIECRVSVKIGRASCRERV